MQIYLETKRLILREFMEEDIKELHNICSQPYIFIAKRQKQKKNHFTILD